MVTSLVKVPPMIQNICKNISSLIENRLLLHIYYQYICSRILNIAYFSYLSFFIFQEYIYLYFGNLHSAQNPQLPLDILEGIFVPWSLPSPLVNLIFAIIPQMSLLGLQVPFPSRPLEPRRPHIQRLVLSRMRPKPPICP